MTIGTKIIKRALRKIQVHTLNSPASPEDIDEAVLALNSMIAGWISKNIEIGVLPLESAGNELGEPLDTTNAIISNLAIYLADNYEDGQAVVTATLRNNARRDFEDLKSQGYRTLNLPRKVPSPTLLTGEGNKTWWDSYRTFFGPGTTLGGTDGLEGFSSGSGGSGGGIPGPPGPPGPEGPQGPPGSEVFATQAEVIAGVVTDKSIAPDTAHGLLASPPNIGTTIAPQIISGGGWALEKLLGTAFLTVTDFSPGVISASAQLDLNSTLAGSFIKINGVNWPTDEGVSPLSNNVLPQFKSATKEIVWEAPHEILNLANGGDLVYNNVSDVLTALPIGTSTEFLGSTGSVPVWKQLPSSAHRNFIISGDFSEVFPDTTTPSDDQYVTSLWRYRKGTSVATHNIIRDIADIPPVAQFGHVPNAMVKILVSSAETVTPNDGRTAIQYTITGTDYAPLARKAVTFYFVGRSDNVLGPFSAAFQNATGGRTLVQEFNFTTVNVWETIAISFTCDVEADWEITDNQIGMNIFLTFAAGADFQTNSLNVFNNTVATASTNQANINSVLGNDISITLIGFNEGTNTQYLASDVQTEKRRIAWYKRDFDLTSTTGEQSPFMGRAITTSTAEFVIDYGMEMRIPPASGKINFSAAAGWLLAHANTTAVVSSFGTPTAIGKNSCKIVVTVTGTPLTVGQSVSLIRNAVATSVQARIDARHYV